MIVPHTYGGALFLAILSLFCLGSWANLYKLAGKWRYELFYFDFAIGLALTGALAALTLGSMGFDGFILADDMYNAGKRQWMFALLAGAVFNLGNYLIMAAVSVAGIAVAFVAGIGAMLIVAMMTGLATGARVNHADVWFSSGLFLLAIILDCVVNAAVARGRRQAAAREAAPGRKVRRPGAVKGIVLAVTGGALTGIMYILLADATPPEVGLGPYALMMLFGIGAFVSTIIYNIFFMNLPVQGQPLEILDYLKVRPSKHLWGLAAGFVWCTGMLANWLLGQTPPKQALSRQLALALPHSGLLLAALWGMIAWRELRGSGALGKVAAVLMWLVAAGALYMMSQVVAPTR
jgi:glucose uptake protein